MSSDDTLNHALVLGASGIVGWAVVNALLSSYPTPDTFASVTALSNRPIDPETTLWPENAKLRLVSGIDLLEGEQGDLEMVLREEVKVIREGRVTHVFFCAYVWDADGRRECVVNSRLLGRTIEAVENCCEGLRMVVLPLGAKVRAVSFGSNPFSALSKLVAS